MRPRFWGASGHTFFAGTSLTEGDSSYPGFPCNGPKRSGPFGTVWVARDPWQCLRARTDRSGMGGLASVRGPIAVLLHGMGGGLAPGTVRRA